MEVTAKKSLYIRGLQAAYSGVLEVIDDAFHVAVYRYFTDRSKWERMDIEGSAYLTRNSSIPLYSLIVLNKKGKILLLEINNVFEVPWKRTDFHLPMLILNYQELLIWFFMWRKTLSEHKCKTNTSCFVARMMTAE